MSSHSHRSYLTIQVFQPCCTGGYYNCESTGTHSFNSLAPGRSECDSGNVIFNLVLLIGIRSSHDNALRWMTRDLTNDKSRLVQVMAWCRQATSHYLSQCSLSSLSPYGVTKPQWVNQVTALIWRSDTLRWNLRVPDLQISCSDWTKW